MTEGLLDNLGGREEMYLNTKINRFPTALLNWIETYYSPEIGRITRRLIKSETCKVFMGTKCFPFEKTLKKKLILRQ